MKKGAWYVLFCYISWGILPVFWKTLAAVDAVYLLASRILWALGLTALLLTIQRKWSGVKDAVCDREERMRMIKAGVLISINWGVYIGAVNSGHLIDASLAYYIVNPLTALTGTIIFKEKLTWVQWFSVGLTVTGITVAAVQFQVFPWIALLIGGSFALYGTVKKRVKAVPEISLFLETATVTPLALVYVVAAEIRNAGAVGILHGGQWMLLPIGGVVTILPLMFFAKGIKTTRLSLSGVLMYINPTLQLLIGVLLYQEKFTSTHMILFGFVWTGLVLYLISGWKEQKKASKENLSCV